MAQAVLAFGSCVGPFVETCVESGVGPCAVDPIVAIIIATAIAGSSGLCAVSLKLSACCICRFLSCARFLRPFPAPASCARLLRSIPALARFAIPDF